MDEVKWYEDTPLETIKNIIKDNFSSASRSFITIGYYLKDVRNRELYIQDGYKDIWEFAQAEFGISTSTASRFMGINDKFSIDGNSPVLQEEYKNFGSGKLQEMLSMSDEQIGQVTEDTTVVEIKKMKKKDKPESIPVATSQEKTIDDLDLSVAAYNWLRKAGIDTIKELTSMTLEDLTGVRNVGKRSLDEIIAKLKDYGFELKGSDKSEDIEDPISEQVEGQTSIQEDFPELLPEQMILEDAKSHDVESPKPRFAAMEHLKEAIKREEESITAMRDSWKKSNPDALLKHETILLALKLHLTDMEYPVPVPEVLPVEQPELPILKNNDQRKDFIDAYETWPVWIDQKETGEKYYRYDLSDAVSIVVKVSKKHVYEKYKETKNYEYGAEQYYLLGIKFQYGLKGSSFTEDSSRTFYECNTNKTAIVDYLREFQKKER